MIGVRVRSPFLVVATFATCVAIAAGAMRAQSASDQPPAPPEALEQPRPSAVASHAPPRAVTTSLFAGFIATQALDVHSTLKSIDHGGRERNGMVRWATSSPAAFIGLKAATTTATCLIIDRVRRKHPKRAMLILAGLDAAYSVIVAHNYMTATRR